MKIIVESGIPISGERLLKISRRIKKHMGKIKVEFNRTQRKSNEDSCKLIVNN